MVWLTFRQSHVVPRHPLWFLFPSSRLGLLGACLCRTKKSACKHYSSCQKVARGTLSRSELCHQSKQRGAGSRGGDKDHSELVPCRIQHSLMALVEVESRKKSLPQNWRSRLKKKKTVNEMMYDVQVFIHSADLRSHDCLIS